MSRSVLLQWSAREFAPGPYPERNDGKANRLDRWVGAWTGRLAMRASRLRLTALRRFAAAVEALAPEMTRASNEALAEEVQRLRGRIAREGLTRAVAAHAFALVREAAGRRLGMRHYPTQLMGGYALLRGTLAEMATGEGKSLTAVLPAVAVALARIPVHVVTVNEYLARRDAEQMKPVYAFFGLTVGYLEPGQDPETRRAMYACDITYCVNKDLVFDYLRDRLPGEGRQSGAQAAVGRLFGPGGGARPTLRGLFYAIIDEADSVLIDEARTPLIISADRGDALAPEDYQRALALAGALGEGEYAIAPAEHLVRLTPAGRGRVERDCAGLEGFWRFRKAREEMIEQALAALRLFERDQHYLVAEGKVQIVDEFTGRTMADRSWERGLHQLIEAKEGLPPSSRRETIARVTYQRFFRRYLWLAGMSGTAAEVAPELRAVFGLDTLALPTQKPLLRRNLGERVFVSAQARWEAVVERAAAVRQAGRAVLIGTRSVEASEALSERLTAAGIAHAMLNARQDQEEARVVAEAGQPGRVTVATNMAGRGTDILLHPQVRAAGGLHVILTEFHESRRIDRQLFGRAGRQGDPGSHESLVSLEDELFVTFAPALARALARRPGPVLPAAWGRLLRRLAQARADRLHARVRRRTLEADKHVDRSLAFSGRGE